MRIYLITNKSLLLRGILGLLYNVLIAKLTF